MFDTILSKQEQIIWSIFVRNKNHTLLPLRFLAKQHQINPRTLVYHLNAWLHAPNNRPYTSFFHLTSQSIQFEYTEKRALDLFAHLLQQNLTCQLLREIFQQQYATLNELACALHISLSTAKRQIEKLRTLLAPYQIQLSFRHAPILKGCELRIRWLDFCLSLIFDPPFQWFDSYELYHRFLESQSDRQKNGCSLNQLAPAQISFHTHFPYQMSERAWSYLARQLFGMSDYFLPFDHLAFLVPKKELLAFFANYQTKLYPPTTCYPAISIIAEN